MTELTEKQTANEETTNNVETKTELSVDEKALKEMLLNLTEIQDDLKEFGVIV